MDRSRAIHCYTWNGWLAKLHIALCCESNEHDESATGAHSVIDSELYKKS